MKTMLLGCAVALVCGIVRAVTPEGLLEDSVLRFGVLGDSEMMMDPTRLAYMDGKIGAFVSTENWAVGVDDVSVDGKIPENVCKVELVPFEDEDNTLTYFRAPNIKEGGCVEDVLFVDGK